MTKDPKDALGPSAQKEQLLDIIRCCMYRCSASCQNFQWVIWHDLFLKAE